MCTEPEEGSLRAVDRIAMALKGERLMELAGHTQTEINLAGEEIDPICEGRDRNAEPVQLWAARRVSMTLNQFLFFATVAKHQNLTKASVELSVSQPSISQQLKVLEDHYGTRLYRRTHKGVEVTAAGEIFLRAITPILDQVAKLQRDCRPSAPKRAREILRVGGTDSASAVLLPSVLADFRRRYPTAELEMSSRTSNHLERMVSNAQLDLALTLRQPRSSSLAYEPLRREKIAMFAPSNHPLARKSELQLADVLAEPLITRGGRGGSGVVDKALQQIRDRGFDLKIGMHCDGPTSIKAAVRQKMGVGIVFEDATKAEVASGEFKILKVPGIKLEGESFIIYSKKRKLSPLAQEFLELLRSKHSQDSIRDRLARRSYRNQNRFAGSRAAAPV